MSTDNLILTEHAIKRHAKRLQKQMKNYSQDLSLGEVQNLLSKILGFNDWNHLNTILNKNISIENTPKKQSDFPIIKISANQYDSMMIEQYGISLTNAEKYFEMYCKSGDIEAIEKYLKSDNSDIQNYIKVNSHYFFKIAAAENQLSVCKILSSLPYCKLEDMSDDEITHILGWTSKNEEEDDVFNYIFYDLNLPLNLDYKSVNHLLELLVQVQNLDSVKNFINDSRIKSLVDIHWSTPSGIFHSITVNEKHSIPLVKYFIKNYDMKITETNIENLCKNKDIKFIKYILKNTNATNYLSSLHKAFLEEGEDIKVNSKNKDLMTLPESDLSCYLNDNLLSLAISYNNFTLFNYLLENEELNIQPSEYNFLVVENACYYCNLLALKVLLKYEGCEEFLKNNAQRIFDKLSESLIYNKNEEQYKMCKYLLEKYKLKIKSVSTKPRNSKLYMFLMKTMAIQ